MEWTRLVQIGPLRSPGTPVGLGLRDALLQDDTKFVADEAILTGKLVANNPKSAATSICLGLPR
jgi:hypothetical protein